MTAAAVAWASALLAAVAAAVAAVVSMRRDGRLATGPVVTAVAAGLVVEVVGLVAGRLLVPLDLFGILHVLYLGAVAAPSMAAVLVGGYLVTTRRSADRRPQLTPVAAVAGGVAVLAGAVGVFTSFVEPARLQVHDLGTVDVADARTGTEPVRVAVLSDIQTTHVGEHEERAISAALEAQPDVILLPGDVFQGPEPDFERELPALRRLLGRLRAPGGVYLVEGDVDSVHRLQRIAEGSEVRVLDDEVVRTEVRGRVLTIGGASLHSSDGVHSVVAGELEGRAGDDDIRILLAHRPDVVLGLPANPRTDLVVAGHTHGGQISVPGFGPLMTLSAVPRPVAAGGLHDLDGRRIVVSAGVGMERGQAPAIRFAVPPSVPVFTIR